MNKNISQFRKQINDSINKIHKKVTIRKRNINYRDILYASIRMNGCKESYEIINSNLKKNKIINVSSCAISQKRNSINYLFFEELNDDIRKHIYKKDEIRLIGVDGSKINLFIDLHLEGFHLSQNKKYTIGLVSCLFDINKEMPINYHLVAHLNERKALFEQLKYVTKKDILIMDRVIFAKICFQLLIKKK